MTFSFKVAMKNQYHDGTKKGRHHSQSNIYAISLCPDIGHEIRQIAQHQNATHVCLPNVLDKDL